MTLDIASTELSLSKTEVRVKSPKRYGLGLVDTAISIGFRLLMNAYYGDLENYLSEIGEGALIEYFAI